MPPRFNIERLKRQLLVIPETRVLLAGGAGATWTDWKTGDHMTGAGGATINAEGLAVFDGVNDYFETPAGRAPLWAPGFAGTEVSVTGYEGKGIGHVFVIEVDSPADLTLRTLIQWDNADFDAPRGVGTDWTNHNLWFDENGVLWCWCRSYVQEGAYLDGPVPTDRLFPFRDGAGNLIDWRPLLADGKRHVLIITRGTSFPPEAKAAWLDGRAVATTLTGNGIKFFHDWSRPMAIGRAFTTTIIGGPTLAPFKGRMQLYACLNTWIHTGYARAIWYAAAGSPLSVPWLRGTLLQERNVA